MLHYLKQAGLDSPILLYFKRRNELTVEENCLLLGMWLVIYNKRLSGYYNESHAGVTDPVWLPGIQNTLEECVKNVSRMQVMS